MNNRQFNDTVEKAVEMLPEEFRSALDNVDIEVQNYPGAEMNQKYSGGGTLLGLYVGIPITQRGSGWSSANYSMVAPDRIYLFRKNIEKICQYENKPLIYQIRETLFHEIGHYLGLNEEQVRQLKYSLINDYHDTDSKK